MFFLIPLVIGLHTEVNLLREVGKFLQIATDCNHVCVIGLRPVLIVKATELELPEIRLPLTNEPQVSG